MKRLITLLTLALVVATLSSCTITQPVSSYQALEQTVEKVKADLEKEGYKLMQEESEVKNEISVAATSYSSQTGFGTKMQNNTWNHRLYGFKDAAGDQVEIKFRYNIARDRRFHPYIFTVDAYGCTSTNTDQFPSICGDSGIVSQLENLPKDIDGTFKDPKNGSRIFGVTSLTAMILLLAYFIGYDL